MLTKEASRYSVIPLSIQKDGDFYTVGNADLGDFYQFPEQGVEILDMLVSGNSAGDIKSRLADAHAEQVDVDEFIDQLTGIGFIYPEGQAGRSAIELQAAGSDRRRVFSLDTRIAKAIISLPVLLGCLAIMAYALASAIRQPELRLNFNAFYIEHDRTPLLLSVMALSVVLLVMHELAHMVAAATHGIRSRYGLGTRLWNVVAEADLSGIMSLPRSKRYMPLLAGMFVDVLNISLLTLLLKLLFSQHAGLFAIKLVQALALEELVGLVWQFNIFVKTDVYFVLCNYFSCPDLDRDARRHLRGLLHRATFGRFGASAGTARLDNPVLLRAFTLVWLVGRILSLCTLVLVVIPTIWKYAVSVIQMLQGAQSSTWDVVDTSLYVCISASLLGIGMYVWLRERGSRGEIPAGVPA